MPPPFVRHGPRVPASPLVIAVPHAGRDYPHALLAASRLPPAALARLEDRRMDELVAPLVARGHSLLVAHRARAWIDLNRDPRDVDPAMLDGPLPGPAPSLSAKTRGGLGLVPRRIGGQEIWRDRLAAGDVAARIADGHRPYHAALAAMLAAARDRFGVALLVDCHSMPPLPNDAAGHVVRAVVGDLYGRSAAPRFATDALAVLRGAGLRAAVNRPYAGGYALERHGAPRGGVHALQIELCRTLYLDPALNEPGSGWRATQALLSDLVDALNESVRQDDYPVAAE